MQANAASPAALAAPAISTVALSIVERGEAGGSQDLLDVVGLAERQRAGRARRLGVRRAEAAHADRERQREPGIALERRPADEGEAPAGAQRGQQVGKGRDRVGEEHHAEARDQQIVGAPLESVGLGIAVDEADVAVALLGAAPPRERQHRLGDVEREHRAVGPDALGQRQRGGAGAAADVDHALARRHRRAADQPVGDEAEALIELAPDGRPIARRRSRSSTRPGRDWQESGPSRRRS